MSPNPSSAQCAQINNSSVISLVPYQLPDHANQAHPTLREGFNFTLNPNQVSEKIFPRNEESADFPQVSTAVEQSIDLNTMNTLEQTETTDVNNEKQSKDSFSLATVASRRNSAPTHKNGSKKIQGGDLLSAYLAEIRRYPLLDPQTELEYAKKIQRR